MLLSYAFSSFHSFAERTNVSFELTKRDTVHGWDRTSPSGKRVTTALAVVGANGAGKTNLLKVGPFLAWFVSRSFSLEPDSPIAFSLHGALPNEPAKFEVEVDTPDGTCWRYELVATPSHVIHESLYRKDSEAGSRYSYVFKRDKTEHGYDVRQQGFGLAESEASKVRPNVSLISWAKQYGTEMAVKVSDFVLRTNIQMTGKAHRTTASVLEAAQLYAADSPLQKHMRMLLRDWDFGLSDVRLQYYETPNPQGGEPTGAWYPMGEHESGSVKFALPFAYESSGTQTAFVLLADLLPVLATGGIAFIDELESDLHPHMIEPILRLFHDPVSNPKNAQVVFTCQSPEVLKVLQRSQVMFVEKRDCMSMAYRGDEIEGLTSEHNLYAKYMSGALGAVPQV